MNAQTGKCRRDITSVFLLESQQPTFRLAVTKNSLHIIQQKKKSFVGCLCKEVCNELHREDEDKRQENPSDNRNQHGDGTKDCNNDEED